jgi:membrane-associated HD superfamily phosphohydrolase
MNEVTIFTDITTEHALLAIEEDAKTYTGLYVDMNEAKGRKFVKESAANIGDILKRLDRARIDKAKDFKTKVEQEAAAIRFRLEEANKPFTLLIEEYNAERKKVLDAENARKKAIEDQAAIDSDYEIAELLMGKYFDDKAKAEQQRIAYEENLKREAAEQAVADAKLLAEQLAQKAIQDKQDAINEAARLEAARVAREAKYKQDAIDAENRRLADIEATKQAEIDRQQKVIDDDLAEKARLAVNQDHVATVHRNMKAVYIAAGFPDDLAEVAVKLLVKNKVPNTTFNY